MKLISIFEEFRKEKSKIKDMFISSLKYKSGHEFEKTLLSFLQETYFELQSDNFKKLYKDNDWKKIKKIHKKFWNQPIDEKLENLQNKKEKTKLFFVYQPFGSQQYPDFLFSYNNKWLAIECKSSSKSTTHPTWNSSLPRQEGIYIFGSYTLKDITFFKGENYISKDRSIALQSIFDESEKYMKNLEMRNMEDTSFTLYLRRMYNQKFNSFTIEKRWEFETSTINYIKKWFQ